MQFLHWLTPWEPSLTVAITIGTAAVAFFRGCRNHALPAWRRVCFWSGLLSLYVSLHTDLDYYAEHAFFMHRLQHSTLHHLGPFLIAVSRPGLALAAGVPAAMRDNLKYLLNVKAVRQTIDFFNYPLISVMLFCGLIVLWLLPSVHFIAMLDSRWYRLMNWSMALDGLMFWNLTLNAYALRPVLLTPATRILMMLAVIPPQIIIGALLFFAPSELYPVYSICGRVFGSISPSMDQQLGGLILWIHGAMMSVIGMLVVMKREWMK